MNITIVGVGNAGSTLAAFLSARGHRIILLKTSNKLHNDHYEYLKKHSQIKVIDDADDDFSAKIDCITDSFAEAIPLADFIIVYVQTNYHEQVIQKMSEYLHDGQFILFEPGYLATCYLLKYCNKDVVSIEAESSPIDCRITEPGVCRVLFKNVINPVGVFPKYKEDVASVMMDKLGFPYRFTSNVFEAALHNPNLIVHTVGAIFSIPRIEYTNGDYWMYKEVFTPHVWNICESLDKEKMKIMQHTGIKNVQSYVQACQERNFIDDPRSPLDSFFDYALNSSPKGPSVPDSRYITEDVPEGLVLLESLGKAFNIPTPTCSGLIDVANAALSRDFRSSGRTVQKLDTKVIELLYNDN